VADGIRLKRETEFVGVLEELLQEGKRFHKIYYNSFVKICKEIFLENLAFFSEICYNKTNVKKGERV
jgi:hypothetical protein